MLSVAAVRPTSDGMHCNALCSLDFVDGVIFSHHGANEFSMTLFRRSSPYGGTSWTSVISTVHQNVATGKGEVCYLRLTLIFGLNLRNN